MQMKTYLVGGYVRDTLMRDELAMNITPKDRDWVVVNSTETAMLAQGYTRVGTFPVFLHPKTHEEYALARTERKNGHGYTGFDVYFSPDVTLEEDLARRDLTINAMAQDPSTKQIIDPYNGRQDLNNQILRHVSPAFAEDPLRVLRVARFASRYPTFSIADETLQLMRNMVTAGELAHLTPERVWKEMESALCEQHPEIFFETLRSCGALSVIWPELDALWGVPNPALHHPEICSGVHTMMVLQQACLLSPKLSVRFAALCHDLGKGISPEATLPSHRGHESYGLPLVEASCARFKTPNKIKELSLKVCQYHLHTHKAFELKPSTILKLFNKLDVWRKPDQFEDFLLACEADARGRLGFERRAYPQAKFLREAVTKCAEVNAKKFVEKGIHGKQIKEAMNKERVNIIQKVKHNHDQPN